MKHYTIFLDGQEEGIIQASDEADALRIAREMFESITDQISVTYTEFVTLWGCTI